MTKEANTDTTFIKITNKDIYTEIINIKDSLEHFKGVNQKQHKSIEEQVLITNGKVKLNRLQLVGVWSAISGIIFSIVWIINFIV